MSNILDEIAFYPTLVERFGKSTIRMIEDANRVVGSVTKTIEAANRHIHRITNEYGPIIQWLRQFHQTVERLKERDEESDDRIRKLFRKLKWPPPSHIPCSVFYRIVEAYCLEKEAYCLEKEAYCLEKTVRKRS